MEEESAKEQRRKTELEAAKRAAAQESSSSSSAAGGSVIIALPFTPFLKPHGVEVGLQDFLRGLFPQCDRPLLQAKDVGGGGDCLFLSLLNEDF